MQYSARRFRRTLRRSSVLVVLLGAALAAQTPSERDVRAVLQSQVDAWNRGDIDGYMRGYRAGDSTVFVSGGSRIVGYDTVLARYRSRYSTKAAMGALTFDDLRIRFVAPGTAIADGVWRLKRDHDAPWGRFTLIVERGPEGWRITHDHTSSAE